MSISANRTVLKARSSKKKNRKYFFTKTRAKTWIKRSARYYTLHKLSATLLRHSFLHRRKTEGGSWSIPFDSGQLVPSLPPHPPLLHITPPQPPHPHTLSCHFPHPPSRRPKSLLQQQTKMAHANPKLRFQEQDHTLPVYSTTKKINNVPSDIILEKNSVTELYVLCIPLHKLSRPVQFVTCVLGVMFFYLLYGYTQEWIFSMEGFKEFGWFLTVVQFLCYSLFGFAERSIRNEGRRRIPLRTYALLAFLTVSTMGLSNISLGYLNYPTQVIFKSCKLIPVMLGGMLIQGKKYTVVDGLALVCMSIGLIMFTLADSTVQPEFNQTGVALISLALCADAVIGNVQEKALKQYSATNLEMVLYSYFIGFWYILLVVVLSGSLLPALSYCLQHPEMYFMAFVFSLTGYLGINFVLTLVRSFGALLAVTVTTFRKAITMVLSFLLFTKPFTSQYIWAGLIVLLGILLNVYNKNRSKVNSWVELTLMSFISLFQRRKYTNSPFRV